MLAYCGNNPVSRTDSEGNFFDTILDVGSLLLSVADVIANPTDVGAWIGLALDAADVVLPGVTGLVDVSVAVSFPVASSASCSLAGLFPDTDFLRPQ